MQFSSCASPGAQVQYSPNQAEPGPAEGVNRLSVVDLGGGGGLGALVCHVERGHSPT